MKFKYRKVSVSPSEAFPKRNHVLRPIIPLSIITKRRRVRYEALIDSGSDYTIFPKALEAILGLSPKKGKKESVVGVSGASLDVYFHHISIEVGGSEVKIYAGFAEAMNQDPGILGQNGFFDLFTVKFNLTKEEIEIRTK